MHSSDKPPPSSSKSSIVIQDSSLPQTHKNSETSSKRYASTPSPKSTISSTANTRQDANSTKSRYPSFYSDHHILRFQSKRQQPTRTVQTRTRRSNHRNEEVTKSQGKSPWIIQQEVQRTHHLQKSVESPRRQSKRKTTRKRTRQENGCSL